MIEVKFYDCSFEPGTALTYSVILPHHKGKWVFIRHRNCSTWEMPGGHIEAWESALEAAGRELYEETGAINFSIECIATYSVTTGGHTGWGRLFLAEIPDFVPVPDTEEVEELSMADNLPENLTYPEIQSCFFEKIRGEKMFP
jgi:8-oxo-dGTP diphosphatase